MTSDQQVPEACAGGWCDHYDHEIHWWMEHLGCTESEAKANVDWMNANT